MRIGSLQCDFQKRFYVMGILNVTPDSFSDGGQYCDPGSAMDRVHEMIAEGVDLIDIGGESTRPGAECVSPEEEWARVGPVIQRIRQEAQIPLSIDTRKASVASKAVEAGVNLINDVSGGQFDIDMATVVQTTRLPYVVMHMRGIPTTMKQEAIYQDVVSEVNQELGQRIRSLLDQGVSQSQLILDPGLGFAKTAEQSWQLLSRLETLQKWGCPLLVGWSNKSFINSIIKDNNQGKLEVNLAIAAVARSKGAGLIRVHHVAPTVKVRKVMEILEIHQAA
jgi:dihydropteroate synthase